MKLKTYETPEIWMIPIIPQENFCTSGGVDDFDVQDPPVDFFDAPIFIF